MQRTLLLSAGSVFAAMLVLAGGLWLAESRQRERLSTIALGMSVSEVQAILGPPTEIGTPGGGPSESQLCTDRPVARGTVFTYDLRRGRKYLVIFAEDGGVACSGLEVTHSR